MPPRKANTRNTAGRGAPVQPSAAPLAAVAAVAPDAVPAPAPPIAAVPVPAADAPVAGAGGGPGQEIFNLEVLSSDDEGGQQAAPGQASTGSKSAAQDINFFFNRAPQGSKKKTVCLACR